MKKFISIIITLTVFFSTINITFAEKMYSEWYIERILDLNVWIEEYDLALAHIDQMYFRDYNTQMLFEEYKNASLLLNQEIIRKYREWEFEYYQINWIISNQKKFIYHINKLFYYISIKEQNPNYIETDSIILEHYNISRTYYKRTQSLVNKNR